MGSVGKIVEGFDVDETIFVAVGDNFDKSKTMLLWTIQNFSGKKICVLHVHRTTRAAPWNRKLGVGKFKQLNADQGIEQFKSPKVALLLEPYLFLLSEAGVHAGKLCISTYNVEEGIIQLIVQQNIKWLVMGAASDKYYSRKMTSLKSKKALFVCKEAPISCHIWFVCKGYLIYTRNVTNRDSISKGRYDSNTASPLLLLDSSRDTKQSADLQSAYMMRRLKFQALLQSRADAEEDGDDSERDSRGSTPCWSQDSGFSTSDMVVPYISARLTDEEDPNQGHVTCKTDFDCGKAILDAKKSKRKVFEIEGNRWEGEDCASAMEAKCKSEALESLSVEDMRRRAELEELLRKEKQEIENVKNQNDEAMKELEMVRDLNVRLKNQIAEMQGSEKELEEKILTAVELLISFKKKRDDMRIEHFTATRKVKALGKMVIVEPGCSHGQEFSFEEIIEATNEFDASCKIGEGKYESVYKGVLHHAPVAIKMFPSNGSQSLGEFQDQVELVTKLRHPNLVTLMGTCWESRSLVYEYMHNGSLEDHLSCSGNSPTLSWQTRARVAFEVCTALLFLHSHRPCITHGNLKPSNILLDLNFVSKIVDYGIFHMALQDKGSSSHMDPNFFETGKVTPESDIYSFGIILLQLLTRRPIPGVVRDVKCALESGNFDAVLDHSAGDWSPSLTKELAGLAVRCCEKNHQNRPRLSEILRVLEPMKASFFSPSSSISVPRDRKTPSHFLCPIFQEVMKDPLIAADGFTYEAEAIREWIKSGHDTSPMTNLRMENCNLIPNHALHQAIQEWQQMW